MQIHQKGERIILRGTQRITGSDLEVFTGGLSELMKMERYDLSIKELVLMQQEPEHKYKPVHLIV